MPRRTCADIPQHMLAANEKARQAVQLSRRATAGQLDMLDVLFPPEENNCSVTPQGEGLGGLPSGGEPASTEPRSVLRDKPATPASNTGVQEPECRRGKGGKRGRQ